MTAVNDARRRPGRRPRAAAGRGPRGRRDRRSRRGRPVGQRGVRRRRRAVHPRRPRLHPGPVLVGRSRTQRLPPLPRAAPRDARAGHRPGRRDRRARAPRRARQPRDRARGTAARLARGDGGGAIPHGHRRLPSRPAATSSSTSPAAARSRPIPGRATPTAPSVPPRPGAGRGRRRICRRPRPCAAHDGRRPAGADGDRARAAGAGRRYGPRHPPADGRPRGRGVPGRRSGDGDVRRPAARSGCA